MTCCNASASYTQQTSPRALSIAALGRRPRGLALHSTVTLWHRDSPWDIDLTLPPQCPPAPRFQRRER